MVTITRGRDKSFIVKLKSKSTGDAMDLSLLKAAGVKFLKDDGSYLSLTLSDGIAIYGSALNGKLKVTIDEDDSEDLKVVTAETLELDHEFGSASAGDPANDKDTTYITQAYSIKKAKGGP